MKFCKDCRFFKNDEKYGYMCLNTLVDPSDPVTGRRAMLRKCYEERDDKGGCGPEGKNFKPSLSHQFKELLLYKLKFNSYG